MGGRFTKGVAAALTLVCALLVATAAWAATTTFTIHKVDQGKNPIAGVKFEVYGKPTITVSEPETTDVTITKEWVDASDKDGARPSADELAAALHLLADGEEVKDVTPEVLSEGDSWTITYQGLPKESDSGVEISYTVSEDAIDGYITKGSPAENGGTITNTLSREVVFRKCWSFYDWRDEGKRIMPEDYAPYVELWTTTNESYDPRYVYHLPLDAYTRMDNQPTPVITDTGQDKNVIWYVARNGSDTKRYWSGSHVYRISYSDVPKYDTDGNELHYVLRENHITVTGYFESGTGAELFNPNDIGIVSPTTKQDFINYGVDEATAAAYESFGFTVERPLTPEEWLDLGFEDEANDYGSNTPYSSAARVFWIPAPMYAYGVGEGYTLINHYYWLIEDIGLIS